MSRRSYSPEVEAVERRVALSNTMAAPLAGVHVEAVRLFSLNGKLRGSVVQQGSKLTFNASGRLAGTGPIQMTGYAYLYVHIGYPETGELVLSNSKGTIALSLGFGPKIPFHVVSGTGAYASASGHGTFSFSHGPRGHAFSLHSSGR
jgi:hypothetical protein